MNNGKSYYYFKGTLQLHKWENCFTIDRYSWGYRRNANIADFFTTKQLIYVLARTISVYKLNISQILIFIIFKIELII